MRLVARLEVMRTYREAVKLKITFPPLCCFLSWSRTDSPSAPQLNKRHLYVSDGLNVSVDERAKVETKLSNNEKCILEGSLSLDKIKKAFIVVVTRLAAASGAR